ncbi:MAG TPA: hypothetical protein VGO93_19705 [Candidatus Xenobia bacterium]|jgi:hypothetical protein
MMESLPSAPCFLNRRFRLIQRRAVYGQVALFDAEDRGTPLLMWLVPSRSPQASALTRIVDRLGRFKSDHWLTFLATGDVVAGPGTGLTYLATEGVDGTLLDQPADLPELARDLALALQDLHRADLSHRALHPGVVFRSGGRWKLGGLGLVGRGPLALLSLGTRQPSVGFAAPEIVLGGPGWAADAWALGACLLWAAAKTVPFEGDLEAVLDAIARDLPPAKATLPQPLDLVVAGCMLRDVNRRWAPEQVRKALAGQPAGAPPSRPTPKARGGKAWPRGGHRRLALHRTGVTALAWQGEALLSGTEDGEVVLSEGNEVKGRWRLEGRVSAAAFSRGQRFAAAASNGQLLVGSRQNLQSKVLLLDAPLRALAWAGGLQAVTSEGAWVEVDEEGTLTHRLTAPLLWALTPDGEMAVTLDGHVWPADQSAGDGAAALAIVNTPKGWLVGRADGRLVLGTDPVRTVDGEAAVLALAAHPHRQQVACLRRDKTLQLVSLADLSVIHTLAVPGLSVAFTPDGHGIVVGQTDGTIGIWPVV